MVLPKEIPWQMKKVLEIIQRTKASICQKAKISKEIKKAFYLQEKGHYVKQCKSKRKIPTKLLRMIEDLKFNDDYYTWSDNLENALLAIDSQPQESDASIELDDLEESSEEEPVFTLSEERLVDLMMQSRPAFKPYVKMML